MSPEELKNVLRQSGIVGAGGAGFPAYGKLAEGADALVINCAECEPLIYTDYALMREELGAIVEGVTLLMRASGIPAAYMAVKRHRAEMLGLTQDQTLAPGVIVRLLPDAYPMGDEIQLIYEATGRLVRPGCLPITAGVIVYNAETVYNIRAALKKGAPVFVSEWGTSRADGGGGVFPSESAEWLDFLNARGISWANWSLCDKNETSAALKPGTPNDRAWTADDLTESGRFVFSHFTD